jgi:hypothetical protein
MGRSVAKRTLARKKKRFFSSEGGHMKCVPTACPVGDSDSTRHLYSHSTSTSASSLQLFTKPLHNYSPTNLLISARRDSCCFEAQVSSCGNR